MPPRPAKPPTAFPPRTLALDDATLGRTIWRLALPTMLGSILFLGVNLVDTFLIGHLQAVGSQGLAANQFAQTLITLVWAFFVALETTLSSLVSRCWGERDYPRARRYAAQGMQLAFGLSLGLTVLFCVWTRSLLEWMQAAPAVVEVGVPFMRVMILSGLLGFPMVVANAITRATGNTLSPTLLSALMNVINVVGSVVLALGWGPVPALGLMGVAYGTLLARSAGGVLAVALLFSGRSSIGLRPGNFRRFHLPDLQRIWRQTYPALLERLLSSFLFVEFLRIISHLGTTAVAGHSIALRIEELAFMPLLGLSVATATVVGQAIGAGRQRLAEGAVRLCLRWSAWGMGSAAAVLLLFGPSMSHLFSDKPEVVRLAGLALQVAAFELPFLAFTIVLAGALRGAGDTRSPLYASMAGMVLFRIPLALFFVHCTDWGLGGAWIATVFDWGCRTAVLWWFFRRGVWKQIHAREKAIYG